MEEKMENKKIFIYLIGETLSSYEIIQDAMTLFNISEENLRKIQLVLLNTLVTFEIGLELKEQLEHVFEPETIKCHLIPATEYDIARFIIKRYDKPENKTIIKILGGSWSNATAIVSEIKHSIVYVTRSKFCEKNLIKLSDIQALKKNNDINVICKECNHPINDFQLIKYFGLAETILSSQKYYPICYNGHCINHGKIIMRDPVNELHEGGTNLIPEEIIKVKDKELPSNWRIRCLYCDEFISKKREFLEGETMITQLICMNENCINHNSKTMGYIVYPAYKSCWKCMKKPEKHVLINLNDTEQIVKFQPFCENCNELREQIIIKKYDILESD